FGPAARSPVASLHVPDRPRDDGQALQADDGRRSPMPTSNLPIPHLTTRAGPLSRRVLLVAVSILLAVSLSTVVAQDPAQPAPPAEYLPNVSYTLTTGLADGRMAFIGVGGTIDGVANPNLV